MAPMVATGLNAVCAFAKTAFRKRLKGFARNHEKPGFWLFAKKASKNFLWKGVYG
jgi:hypothetical protein